MPNPFLDQHGNIVIDAPKTPSKLLYTVNPGIIAKLTQAAPTVRDKAIISLLSDSGARRSEIVSITVENVDLERHRVRVWGKGNKEGWLIFGPTTRKLLTQYIKERSPQGILFGLNEWGLKSMLDRLQKKTEIRCNAHSFRRGFATELRRKGLSELDIAELGRWSSTAMVKRYSRAYTFDDAATRYKAIVKKPTIY